MRNIKNLLSFVSIGTVVLLCGCNDHSNAARTNISLPTANVRVETVRFRPRVATEEVVGTVRPRLSASISSKTSGIIEQMRVTPGQSVKAGQLLAELDAKEIQARLDQATALRDQAQKDIQRLEPLMRENVVSQQEYDATQARFRVANASVTENQTQLSYTKILAPFDGVITVKSADVGDLVTPGKTILQMEDPSTLRFEADVPDTLISQVHIQDAMAIQLSFTNAPIEGIVNELTPVADPISRTFRVKLTLPNLGALRSGQFGRVSVPVAQVNALRVPTSAIVDRGQMEIAFVVTNQQTQMRLVKTGKQLEGTVEIVSGLNDGDQIIVDTPKNLLDGQPVTVR